MLELERALSFIHSWVNQRWATLLLGNKSIVQNLNIAALNVYFYEGRHWNWMRHKQSFTIPASVTPGDTYTATTTYNIVDVQNICDDTGSSCVGGAYSPAWSDCDMSPGQFYWKGFNKELIFARWDTERTIEVTYYGYNLWTETDTPDTDETILIPEVFLPAIYHFALGVIYPHYTQYWEAREVSAYQMGINYLANIAKSQTTIINQIRPR